MGNTLEREAVEDDGEVLLEGQDLKAVAKFMDSERCRNVFLMVRAHCIDCFLLNDAVAGWCR